MSTAYEPAAVEPRWSDRWEALNVFKMDMDPAKKPFSIVLPPPNVTGSLHLGHATNGTIQDVLCRTRRMQGYGVLWQGGTDHAGIATQNVVERKLRNEEGKSRHDVGREAFIERVWEWKEQSGNTIVNQYRKMGASMDYSRLRFTMDEGYTKAVRKAFVHLYDKGLIYRGNRIINWCPRCLTSLSDLEVVYKESDSTLYHVQYALEDGSGSITIATVRPETILGDVAIAVHPEDERYAAMVGKKVRVPMTDRLVPVIADTHVEREFGTGALKITPAHDPADYEIGQRHGLPSIDVMTPEGTMSEAAGAEWAGMDRFEARQVAAKRLRDEGVLVKEEAYRNNVTHCDRCSTVIEPRLSDQWFVAMQQLAAPAIKVVEDGKVDFTPDRWKGVYLDWLRNIRDWCVSRQLWWGHRIPVWTCEDGHAHASVTDLTQCPTCAKPTEQDPDVLDTWFSSAMWPFATLGWPEKTPEFDYFYPTNVLSTARDIIYLWVARMVFMSMEFEHEIPFQDVVIHATILDAKGQRMSKSKGTGVDPLEIMGKYGTDACRFWFAGAGTSAQDVRYTEDKLEAGRNFANKLWNASRFVLMNLPQGFKTDVAQVAPERLDIADRWILSRLQHTVQTVTEAVDAFALSDATTALYEFVWSEFCDWYLELAKPRMREGDEAVKAVLREVLSTVLRLLHPFMPFITEEIYAQLVAQELVAPTETLLATQWPADQASLRNEAVEAEMALVMEVIRTVRNMRAELGVPPAKKAERLVIFGKQHELLARMKDTIGHLTRSEAVEVGAEPVEIAQAASGVAGENTILLPLEGLLDIQKEVERLKKEQGQLTGERQRLEGQLSNEAFVSKAPAHVVDKLRTRMGEVDAQLTTLAQQIERWA
ncbi:valine--tRNA ligase [bacterium]|nr:valine--tRNA ligase [bacterium]